MIARLPYGDGDVAVDLRGLKVRRIAGSAPAGGVDSGSLVAAALREPVAGDRLRRLAGAARNAVVVVPDGTRAAALPDVLPVVLGTLEETGVGRGATTVLVAAGTHPPMTPERLRQHLGPMPPGISVRQHDCRDEASLTAVGRLEDGTPVRLDREAVEADLLFTVGAVGHHYFAGFGGGPKMVFPGIAGHDEIQRNHARVLDLSSDPLRRARGCDAGVLAGNPVAEEIARTASLRPADFALCLVAGSDGRPAAAWSGPPETAFAAAVERVREWYEVDPADRCKLVVASGGGAPVDATLIQTHKRFDAAWRWLQPGGEMLLVAAMDDGDGSPAMTPFVDDARQEAIVGRLRRGWVQYGHTALRILEKTVANATWLVTRYPGDRASALGFRPVSEAADVIERWREEYPGETVVVMSGPPVYPSVPREPSRSWIAGLGSDPDPGTV